MALRRTQSKPQNLWSVLGMSLVLSLVFGLTVACQMFSGSQGIEDLGAVRMESAEKVPFAGIARTLAYSKGGDSLVVAGCQSGGSNSDNPCATGLVQVWNFQGTSSATTRTLPRGVTALAMSPDGSKWVAGDTEGRLILSATKGVSKPFHQKSEITALAFSPDGKWIASGSLDPAFPLGLMDVTVGGVIRVKTRFEPVQALAFSPDGKTLAVGMTRGGVVLWNFTSSGTPEVVAGSLASSAVMSIAFSPDGELLAYGTQNGKVVVVNRGSGQSSAEYKGAAAVNAIAFSPDGQFLALGQDNGK
ncbi:MAG: WD40 repeat domain-containing protein, partial [Nitrospirae bacterium]